MAPFKYKDPRAGWSMFDRYRAGTAGGPKTEKQLENEAKRRAEGQETARRREENANRPPEERSPWRKSGPGAFLDSSNLAGLASNAGMMGDPGAAGAEGLATGMMGGGGGDAMSRAFTSPEQREAAGLNMPPGGLGDLGIPEPGDQRYQAYSIPEADYPEPMDYTAQIRQNRQEREAGRDPRDKVAEGIRQAPVPVDPNRFAVSGDEFGGMPGMELAGGPPLDPGIMAQQFPAGPMGDMGVGGVAGPGGFPPQTPPAPSVQTPYPPVEPITTPYWSFPTSGGYSSSEDPLAGRPVNPPPEPVPDHLIDPEWNTPSIMNDPSLVNPTGAGELLGPDPWGDPLPDLLPEMPSEHLVPGRPRTPRRYPGSPRVRGPKVNPTDLKTGQGIPISSAMPAPENNLANLSRAGGWRGMV